AVKELVKRGVLLELQTVKDRLKPKKLLTVYPPEDVTQIPAWMEALPASAKKQKQVLAYMAEQSKPIALAELTATLGVGSPTVKSLADKGWLTIREREVMRDPYAGRSFAKTTALSFTPEQLSVYGPIEESLEARSYARFLLHGVTGSGKTEIYLQAIERCIEQ